MAFTLAWVTKFVETVEASLNSDLLSLSVISICFPSTPPALLISSTANLAAFCSAVPYEATSPVSSKLKPILSVLPISVPEAEPEFPVVETSPQAASNATLARLTKVNANFFFIKMFSFMCIQNYIVRIYRIIRKLSI